MINICHKTIQPLWGCENLWLFTDSSQSISDYWLLIPSGSPGDLNH